MQSRINKKLVSYYNTTRLRDMQFRGFTHGPSTVSTSTRVVQQNHQILLTPNQDFPLRAPTPNPIRHVRIH